MRIVNIVPFFDEEEHLLLRIKMLLDSIDLLIICEADKTHSGDEKPLTLNKTLKKLGYLDHPKIYPVTVSLPSKSENQDNWVRERLQRDTAALFCLPDDIVLSTDCDEFFNPSEIETTIEYLKENPDSVVLLPMSMHHCTADKILTFNGEQVISLSAFACKATTIKKWKPSKIREAVSYGNYMPISILTLPNYKWGWHFSWMGNGETRLKKLKSFAHSEDHIEGVGYIQSEEVQQFVRNFKPYTGAHDALNRSGHIMVDYPKENLPKEIFDLEILKSFYIFA